MKLLTKIVYLYIIGFVRQFVPPDVYWCFLSNYILYGQTVPGSLLSNVVARGHSPITDIFTNVKSSILFLLLRRRNKIIIIGHYRGLESK